MLTWAQAVQDQVEQPAGLITLLGRSRNQGDAANPEHGVGGVNIASQPSLCSARFQQGADGLEQALATLGESKTANDSRLKPTASAQTSPPRWAVRCGRVPDLGPMPRAPARPGTRTPLARAEARYSC
jgi:hypothetical protein